MQHSHALNEQERIIAARLQDLRIHAGITLDSLAKGTGESIKDLYAYETGELEIPASTLFIIAEYLECDIEYFFENDEAVPAYNLRDQAQTSQFLH